MQTTYEFTNHKDWTITFLDYDKTDISYHSDIVYLLDLVTTSMITTTKITSVRACKIVNNPNETCPYNVAGQNAIVLNASPGSYWSQYVFQYAHELLHYLIKSSWPSAKDEWFEEVICECASRFWLTWLSQQEFDKPEINSFRKNFKSYADSRTLKIKIFKPESLQKENSGLLTQLRDDHELRPFHCFLANKIMPIINKEPALWQDMHLLNQISDKQSFIKNLEFIKNQAINQSSFQKILNIFIN